MIVAARAWAGAASNRRPHTAAAARVDYLRSIKPLLTRHCVSCHGAEKPRGGLRLDTAAAARKGGKEGPAIVPGKAEESPLLAPCWAKGRPSGCR